MTSGPHGTCGCVKWWWSGRRGEAIRARQFAMRVIGQNLLTWARYGGSAPEVGESSFEAGVAPSDRFQSPLPRRVRVEVSMGVM